VTSAAHTISFSYTSHTGSGTLTVSSGGAVVAQINMIGAYTSANFHITAGISGTVAIVDPTVVNGGSVDLFPLAFGAPSTLAHPDAAGGAPTVGDDSHARVMALMGNYIAGSFVPMVGGPRHLGETEPLALQLAPTHRG
jgi:hypothetical protein